MVCVIHNMNSRELIRRIEAAGWRLRSVRGSHHQFVHPDRPGRVTVPHPKKDIRPGTLISILRQAGLK